jgi:hypothetical protein
MPDMHISSPFETLLAGMHAERSEADIIEELESCFDDADDSEVAVPVVIEPAPAAYRPFFTESALVPAVRPGAAREELVAVDSADEEDVSELIDAEEPTDPVAGPFIVLRDGIAYVSDSAYKEEPPPRLIRL